MCAAVRPTAQALSRNLPQITDGLIEGKAGFWHVRPWRQVELADLMTLYDMQYANVTGTVIRSEEYWRWLIGRRYAHVIWVACQGDAVRGYAFVKDHRILEIASDPGIRRPCARCLVECVPKRWNEPIPRFRCMHPWGIQ